MISFKSSSTVPQSAPDQTGATIHTPHLPIWFHRFRTTEEPDSDFEFEPEDISYPTELRCPNCDRISAYLICSCGVMMQHPDSGDLSCN